MAVRASYDARLAAVAHLHLGVADDLERHINVAHGSRERVAQRLPKSVPRKEADEQEDCLFGQERISLK